MRPTVASWATATLGFWIWMSGQVSEREIPSIISPSHCTRALEPAEWGPMRTRPR